jgi:hypothetical protein
MLEWRASSFGKKTRAVEGWPMGTGRAGCLSWLGRYEIVVVSGLCIGASAGAGSGALFLVAKLAPVAGAWEHFGHKRRT